MKDILLLGLLCILSVSVFIYPIAIWNSSEDVIVTVKKTESIVVNDNDNKGTKSKYLVYTDGEVFENVDSWLYLKFNSSDVQNELTEGVTYSIKVSGWRWQFFSMYRNIVLVRPTKESNEKL